MIEEYAKMMGIFSLGYIEKEAGFKGQHIFYRAGFDCLDENTGEIKDTTRVDVLVPSIKRIRAAGGRVVIYSHNGRPDGQIIETLRMDSIAKRLEEQGMPVKKLDNCVGEKIEKEIRAMQDGDVILAENIRFHPLSVSEEPADIDKLAKGLVFGGGLFKIYVNAAWPVSHRKSADMTGVVKYIEYACADPQVILEYGKAMEITTNPRRPYAVIIGGKKADKTKYVPQILEKADILIPAGAFANSVEYNKGTNIQSSLFDESDKTQSMIKDIFKKYKSKIIRPIDVIATDNVKKPTKFDVYEKDAIPPGFLIVGVGPKSIEHYKEILKDAGAVAWAGPFDVYENPNFRAGTEQIGYFLAEGTNADVMICGGDTGDAAHELKFAEKLLEVATDERKTHISTGGGVNLPLLADEELPAIKVLKENYKKHVKK